MIQQPRKLNLIPEYDILTIAVSQYDTGTDRLFFELYANGELYSPSGTAVIQGTKPSGDTFSHSVVISGSTVTADLDADMTDEYGQVVAQIVLTEGDNRTGSQVFFLIVQQDAEGEL